MPHDQRWLNAFLAAHWGVVTRRLMLAHGMSRSGIEHLLGRGDLVTLARGVYRSTAWPTSSEQVMVAVCLVCPTACVASTTAARMWGFRGMSDPVIHVLVPHGSSPTVPGVTFHRTRRLPAEDIAGRRPDGIRLTSPPRSLVDAAAVVGEAATASAVEQVLSERRLTLATLARVTDRLVHPRLPGALVMRSVLASRPPWRGAARSDLEVRVRMAIVGAGLPEPEVNLRHHMSCGQAIEIDLAWPTFRVACEVDHPFWHDGAAESHRDKQRDRRLAADGWATARITERDIAEDLSSAVADLARILVTRGWTRQGRPDGAPLSDGGPGRIRTSVG